MGDPIPIQQLRQLLAERLPRVRTGFAVRPASATVSTGVRALDLALGGGLLLGETTELVGEGWGSGSAQVIHAVLRRAAADGRFVALVDGADSLDVDALEPAELTRLLWVRCRTAAEALAATDVLLRDRNFPLVVLDLKLNSPMEWRRISGSVWHRFNRLREQHRTTLLVVTPQPSVGGAVRRVRVWAQAPAIAERLAASGRLGVACTGQTMAAILDGLEFTVLRERSESENESGWGNGNPVVTAPMVANDERFALLG